ncbi:hypothetical protein ACFL59_13930 [Planctomycetota bacterium]
MDLKKRLGVLEKSFALQLLAAVARAGGGICEAVEAVLQEAAAELDYPLAEVDLECDIEWGNLASHVVKRSLRKRLLAYCGRLVVIYDSLDAEIWVRVLAECWGLEPPVAARCLEDTPPQPLLEQARRREGRRLELLRSLPYEQLRLLGKVSLEERLLPEEVGRLLSCFELRVAGPEPPAAPRQFWLPWWELGIFGGEEGTCVFSTRSFRHCLPWLLVPIVGIAVLADLGPVAARILAAPLVVVSLLALARPFYRHRLRSRAFLRSAPVEAALVTRIREEQRCGEWEDWIECFFAYAYRFGEVESRGRFHTEKDEAAPVLLGDRVWILVTPWEPKHSLHAGWLRRWTPTRDWIWPEDKPKKLESQE